MHIKMMKKYYFINKFDTNNINKQDKHTIIIYRNYSAQSLDEKLILKIKNYCKKKSIKFYLSNNIKLAIKLDLDGAYIPSFNKNFLGINKFKLLSKKTNRSIVVLGGISDKNLKKLRLLRQSDFAGISFFE